MKSVEIQGTKRPTGETKATIKAVRNSGLVPCVLYGGEQPMHFTTPLTSFKLLVFTPDSYLVNLDVDGKKFQAVLQETQFHALTDEMLHADFMQVFEDKAVVMEVPVKLTGTSVGVLAGGKLQVKLKKLKVKALPKNLPDFVTVDITNIGIGQSVKVGSLEATGFEYVSSANSVVVTVRVTRAATAEAVAAAAAPKAAAAKAPAAAAAKAPAKK
ncbi:MAG: 50S ribosomal protein L25/general stress protein Ctc [Bacteroidetes bacterium]|nr:50S ribosomal protein L25/general stress protein Ctc [Bacteroidota bacterium]